MSFSRSRLVASGVLAFALAAPPAAISSSPSDFGPAVRVGQSAPARELPADYPSASKRDPLFVKEVSSANARTRPTLLPGLAGFDGALDSGPATRGVPAMPGPIVSFDALNNGDNFTAFGFRISPPDTNMDVGPNHLVHSVNLLLRVYDKSGAPLTGPFKMSALFAGLGGVCAATDDGDPIVLYDPLADRWLLSQFALPAFPSPPYHMCIAISQTADPTGAYHLYDFVVSGSNMPDYPKFGVWPDGYYMTSNQFLNGATFNAAGAFVFERQKMLTGDPTAIQIYFDLSQAPFNGQGLFGLLPSDLDGLTPPPAGRANTFMYFTAVEFGDNADGLRFFDFVPDYATPAASTFTERSESSFAVPFPVAAFDPITPGMIAGNRRDIPQPPPAGATNRLQAIGDRLMHRLQYVNFGGYESWVSNHSVNAGGASYRSGIRYYQLTRALPGGSITLAEQATYAPADTEHRWMGSAAVDSAGNLALGFSVSSTTVFPSIRWAGRLAGDPPGGLTLGEATLVAGSGVQTSTSNRWGDYSLMAIDPADDCTFWYTQEYYTAASQATSTVGWLTRVGSFSFAPMEACSTPARGALEVTVTECGTGDPIPGVEVTATGGFFRQTDGAGLADFDPMASGGYTVDASMFGYSPASAPATVTDGNTTQVALCLQGVPVLESAGATLVTESCTPANGAIDPAETVTVSFCVQNIGGIDTVNLVGTLQATGGVVAPSGPQNYGVVVGGGAAVCRNFTFSIDSEASCGGTVTATLALQDGATDLGTATYDFTLGVLDVAFAESFDGAVVPALPAGWVAANAAGADGILWVTSNAGTPAPAADTAPNAAFVNDPSGVHDKRLDTPSIAIGSATAQLTFRNNFDLESTFDGGVLEISIGAGAFQDIVAAGGSFVSGGYTGTISSSFSNPLAGRQAWTGSSNGFVTTVVDLPAAAAGQNVVLRFRMGSDTSVSDVGWRIDTLSLSDGYLCSTECLAGCTLICPADIVTANAAGQCGAPVAFATSGTCTNVTCTPASGAFFAVGSTPVNCSDPAAVAGCSFAVTVNDLEAPALTCPADVQVTVPPGAFSTTVNYPPPAVSDNCPGVTSSCAPPAGDVFLVGDTVVACSALDGSGNGADCVFDVTVEAVSLQEIPTASRLGLAALVLLLAGAALVALRRGV